MRHSVRMPATQDAVLGKLQNFCPEHDLITIHLAYSHERLGRNRRDKANFAGVSYYSIYYDNMSSYP
jgi:hypothetical protein